jgi:hypothetical protein
MDDLDAFLAGDRPDDVVLFLSDSFVEDTDALVDFGEHVERAERRSTERASGDEPRASGDGDLGGVLLVVDGDRGRSVVKRMTGMDAMSFAGAAMDNPGSIDADLVGGDCPNAAGVAEATESEGGDSEERSSSGRASGRSPRAEAAGGPQEHHPEFVFAFAEAQNEEVGGMYAEGDVIHAYAYCSCGTAYSDKWVADSE